MFILRTDLVDAFAADTYTARHLHPGWRHVDDHEVTGHLVTHAQDEGVITRPFRSAYLTYHYLDTSDPLFMLTVPLYQMDRGCQIQLYTEWTPDHDLTGVPALHALLEAAVDNGNKLLHTMGKTLTPQALPTA